MEMHPKVDNIGKYLLNGTKKWKNISITYINVIATKQQKYISCVLST